MSKFTLTLNSHALSDFQRCEMLYGLADLLCLGKEGTKKAFAKGEAIDRILSIYYHRKKKGRHLQVLSRLDLMIKRFSQIVPMEEAHTMINVLIEYFKTYSKEKVEVLGVQKGFSKIIYEDDENLFIYEGCPDLIARFEGSAEVIIMDHKTQGLTYEIYPFNNQALGYCWALEVPRFTYNYLVFKKTDPIRRRSFTFREVQLETWKNDTIRWFFRVKAAMQKNEFLRSWQCQNKFGNCAFTEVCTSVNDAMRTWVIKRDFIQIERHRSW
jgi:hypothetical protein